MTLCGIGELKVPEGTFKECLEARKTRTALADALLSRPAHHVVIDVCNCANLVSYILRLRCIFAFEKSISYAIA